MSDSQLHVLRAVFCLLSASKGWNAHLRCLPILAVGMAVTGTLSASAQPDTAAQYARAEGLIRDHHWDEGIAVLEPLLKSGSRNPRLHNLAGLAYTGKGDREQADRYFESALKTAPNFVPALKNLAINEVALGRDQSARQHLESALREMPYDPVANLYLGELFYKQQDFRQAAERLERSRSLLARDPNLLASLALSELKIDNRQVALDILNKLTAADLTPQSQLTLGVALARADLSDQAIPYLEAAQSGFPASSDIGYDLALCYMAAKRFPDAIRALQQLSAGGHETSETDNLLAEAFEANHQTQPAVDALRRAIALRPDDDDNYLEFASICIDHQDFQNAGKVLSVALGLHPKSSRLLFERGILNAMQDNFDLAEQDFQSAADASPVDNSAYIGLGVTFIEAGKANQAVPMLRSRLRQRPDDANLNYLLGEALLHEGAQKGAPEFVEAQASLEKAVRLDPRLVEPHVSLGVIYLREERFEDAVDQLEQARRLDPRTKSAYSHLAVAYRHLGKQDKAKEVLTELKDINDSDRTGSRQPVEMHKKAPAAAEAEAKPSSAGPG